MKEVYVTTDIKYVGVDDLDIDLFENQYIVPNGVSYNSYIILDEKIAIIDTVDRRKGEIWIENVKKTLNGKNPDYLVISHMEPDHSSSIKLLMDMYPNMKLIGNLLTFKFLDQFYKNEDFENKKIIVKENDELILGKHILRFIMAPMVHWPEVMLSYDSYDKILFTADGFGKFGALLKEGDDWVCEARRYYFGIVGKYGIQVQALLKKVDSLDINMICPLHGPILNNDLSYYIHKYDIWSRYDAEDEGVFIAFASIHGNTKNVVLKMEKMLRDKGIKNIVIADLCRADWAECIENAFRYNKMILAASSYNAGVFTPMHNFLNGLLERNYQNRKVGIIENGTWAPSAAKTMNEILDKMKNIDVYKNIVTVKSTLDEESNLRLNDLVNEIFN